MHASYLAFLKFVAIFLLGTYASIAILTPDNGAQRLIAAEDVESVDEVASLKLEISKMQATIDALKKRIEILEKQSQQTAFVPGANTLQPTLAPNQFLLTPGFNAVPPQFPKGTKRKEINGIPYYVMPIETK